MGIWSRLVQFDQQQEHFDVTYVPGLDDPNTAVNESVREEYQLGLFPVFYFRCDF